MAVRRTTIVLHAPDEPHREFIIFTDSIAILEQNPNDENAVLWVMGQKLAVRETVEQVRQQIENADRSF